MAFDIAIGSRRGRPPAVNRVAASRSSERVLRLSLSMDIAQRLGAREGGSVGVRLGSGIDAGRMLLFRSEPGEQGLFPFQVGRQVVVNIHSASVPNIVVPNGTVTLEFEWRDNRLVIDLSPLQTAQGAES